MVGGYGLGGRGLFLAAQSDAPKGSRGNSVFGRDEWVQKSAEELVVGTSDPDERFDMASLVLGGHTHR